MTSPSRTRLRTTLRPSIPDRAIARAVLAGSLALAVVLPAAASWRDLQRTELPPAVVPAAAAADVEPIAAGAAADRVAPVAAPLALDASAAESAGPDAAAETDADSERKKGDDEADTCREALAQLRSASLADIDIDIRVGGNPGTDYPRECRLEGETFEPRRFATTTFTWKAAGYCHKPLYFEDWNLERYGHSHGFAADSVLSAAHFFARIPALPYQMGVDLPWECVYPLGYYRPGSCAPWTVPAVPVSGRGFLVGAAAATGIVFLLP